MNGLSRPGPKKATLFSFQQEPSDPRRKNPHCLIVQYSDQFGWGLPTPQGPQGQAGSGGSQKG